MPYANTRRLAALAALAVLGVAGRAEATSCAPRPWEHEYASPLLNDTLEVPIDARPWMIEYCSGEGFSAPSGCQLVTGSDSVDVAVELVGTEACSLAWEELIDETAAQYVVRFVPAAPLTPGETYTLECSSGGDIGTLTVRADPAPSAPPPAIAVAEARYSRDHNGCCGWGDSLELRIDGLDDPAFREGGVVEVTYPNGQLFVMLGTWTDGILELPPTEGTLKLTPVAADGERGETIELDAGDVDGDLVYIPCTIAARTSPAALWLLAPFAWISAHGRRRRGRAS